MSGTGTTISNSYVNGITLNDTIDNPVTVTGTITAPSGTALYGMGGPIDGGDGALYGWTVSNAGTIGGATGSGIQLGTDVNSVAGGVVTNTGIGVIYGYTGVAIYGPGSVTNLSGGSITGTGVLSDAILLTGGTGTIVNQGVLVGVTKGVEEDLGGSVTNKSGGIITGTAQAGIQIGGALGTVINYGSVSSTNDGVGETKGGSVTNQADGTITGTGDSAIFISTGLGTVVNYGVLIGGLSGVREALGGSVTNQSIGTITGSAGSGIYISGGTGAVVNYGSLLSNFTGVYLTAGGSVSNQSSAIIAGTLNYGINIIGGPGTIVNDGTLLGGLVGVFEDQGGSVINQSGGTIAGNGTYGIRILNNTGTIINAGSVFGGHYGAYLGGGGTITNQANGNISGGTGIVLDNAPGTVTNAGTISGSNTAIVLSGGSTLTNSGTIHAGSAVEYAVQFSTDITNKLIVDPGAVFYGRITGGGGEIDLAGTGVGALAGFDGTSITNFASLQFEIGADWTISGDSSVDGLSGISSIGGFNVGDTIDLTDFAATSVAFASNQLVLTDAGDATETLNITGGFQTSDFHIPTDGSSTDITVTATCYAAGTRIRTTRGEVAVENLREGDLVLTVSGRTQPISWIGHRHVNFHGHPNRQRILPVRITAHAFGQGTPERDLLLSPDHAVFVEDVLIPIRHLVNGGSIAQIECDTITYYHIELPRHDVLLADGMPAESYLEAGARDAFANVDGVIQLHPDFEPPRDHYAMLWEAEAYAPLVVAGEQLDRARCKLADRAAWPPFGEGVAALPSSPLSANQCLGLPA